MRNETLRRRSEDENSSGWTIKLKVDVPDPPVQRSRNKE
jgi:hypothetical protein